MTVWLAGLQPDLIESFRRLDFAVWLPTERIFRQGLDDDSATLAAIRRIRAELALEKTTGPDRLYYRV